MEGLTVESLGIIVAMMLRAKTRAKGKEWCEKKWIGWMRKSLGPIMPPNVVAIGDLSEAARPRARTIAAVFLAERCKECQLCPWARK